MKILKIAGLAFTGLIAALFIALFIYFFPWGMTEETGTRLLLYNGTIITMDGEKPSAEAVVTGGGRILYVGSLNEASKKNSDAIKIDLKGATLIPGFNDNHTHSFYAAAFYSELVLWNRSCSEIIDLIRKEASVSAPGTLITGNSWDYTGCSAPHRSMLDTAAPDNPIFLTQYSGHAAWVNSRMMKNLGIDETTPDPPGGQIVRDEKGVPTGILRDTAMGASVYGKFISYLFSPAKHRELISGALDLYRRAGITSVQDNTWEPFTVRLLNLLESEGTLTCRFSCWSQGDSFMETLFDLFAFFRNGGCMVRRGPIKYFADGAFSTRTAWLFGEYADEPGNFGSPRYTTEQLEEIVMDAARRKRQIAFHAIGDRAVSEILDAVGRAQEKYPWTKDLRFRLEHVQIVRPGDILRMKSLGIVACVQPFTLHDPQKDLKLLGAKRAASAYPFRSMMKAGIPVSFGSDIPAEVDYQPMLALYYAVTRKSRDGKHGPLNASERFTPLEALYCYTMGSAYAENMEKEKGSITEGKLADMTVLSRNPTTVRPEAIKDIRILMTIVGGKIVYNAEMEQ